MLPTYWNVNVLQKKKKYFLKSIVYNGKFGGMLQVCIETIGSVVVDV